LWVIAEWRIKDWIPAFAGMTTWTARTKNDALYVAQKRIFLLIPMLLFIDSAWECRRVPPTTLLWVIAEWRIKDWIPAFEAVEKVGIAASFDMRQACLAPRNDRTKDTSKVYL